MTLAEFLAEAEMRAQEATGPGGLSQAEIEKLQAFEEEDLRNGIA